MESNTEVIKSCASGPSLCRCCLAAGCYKDISTEYFWMGKREVYAEMLIEAFNITFQYAKSEGLSKTSRLICEQCIIRLRDAAAFKQQIIQCEETFKEHLDIKLFDDSSSVDPLEDLKKEKTEIVFDELTDSFDFVGADDDNDYDEGDNQPLNTLTKNSSKNYKSEIQKLKDNLNIIIKPISTSKVPEKKRPSTANLVPPPIKRFKIPEGVKTSTKTGGAVKRVMVNTAPHKAQLKSTMLGTLFRKVLVPQSSKNVLIQSGSYNKAVSRGIQRITMKQGLAKAKVSASGHVMGKKQIVSSLSVKPSTSSKVPLKPKTEIESSSSRKNAEIIIMQSTAYPFKIPDENMVCVYCCNTVTNPIAYRDHVSTQHPVVNLRGKSIFSAGEGNIKVDISDLKCRICHEAFNDLDSVAQHLHNIHKQRLNFNFSLGLQPYKFLTESLICTVCERKFCTVRALSRHTQSHFSKFPCDKCGKLYSTMHNLKHHITSAHGSNNIRCVRCKLAFSSHDEKSKHLKDSVNCRQYICNVCGEKFPTWLTKQQHMAKDHKDVQTCHRCPECNKTFQQKIEFQKHFRSYHERKDVCPVCDHPFRSKHTLDKHMVVHTKEKKFQCTVCDKLFSRQDALKQHMVIHCDELKFVCKVCGKKFNQRVCWKTHVKSYHPDYADF